MKKNRTEVISKEDYLPTIPEGVTPKQFQAFNLYCEGKLTNKQIFELVGVCNYTFYEWKKADWWKNLYEDYVSVKQRDVYLKMSAKGENLLDGYLEVMEGSDKNDKTASARVQGFKMYLEAGNNPIIQKNPGLTINNNTQVNAVALDHGKLKQLNKTQLLEIARTGVVPEDVKT